jgi:hypothetical protein
MTVQSPHSAPDDRHFQLLGFLAKEWPYFLILALALIGVAYTSFAKTPITIYWIVMVPFVALVCIFTRWGDAKTRDQRSHLLLSQALHWLAVLAAIHLMFVFSVSRMMNSDATALATLIILSLGTFTAGVHVGSWRICLIGVVLAMGVPAIAWLEQSTLLFLIIGIVFVAVIAPLVFRIADRPERDPTAV